jgi:hypothetical protein
MTTAGTCDLCGQVMLLNATTSDAWHPWDVDLPCPPEVNQDGLLVPSWGRPGRPGAEHFRPTPDPDGDGPTTEPDLLPLVNGASWPDIGAHR